MTRRDFSRLAAALTVCSALLLSGATQAVQALPSWNQTPAKAAILTFVEAVTRPGPSFVPPEERVAVFDNDGTLWVEQPIYTQFAFAIQRAAEMARADPALAQRPAFAAVLSGDRARIGALTQEQMLELVTTTHSGMTTEAFSAAAADWLAQTRHPRFQRPYTELVYAPMLELMAYLRAHGFQIYIVSGGDTDFMRVFAERVYGVPPDHVIGSANDTEIVNQSGRWVLMRRPHMAVDDGPAKPANIERQIGRRPIFAAGNSDGDLQMLQYSTSGPGRRLGLIVHHDDADREYAYDRHSSIGHLEAALDAAPAAGWTVVSMRTDWNVVFPRAPIDHPPTLGLSLIQPLEP